LKQQHQIEEAGIPRTQQHAYAMDRGGEQQRQEVLREQEHLHGEDEIEEEAQGPKPHVRDWADL